MLDAAALGVLAGAGLWERPMAVHPRPRVLLAGTGDELVRPGQPLKPGQIYNSNLPQLAARCRQLGHMANTVWWPDDSRAVADGLTAGVRDFDCVITTGGVSVGDKDIFHQALPLAGAERLFWRAEWAKRVWARGPAGLGPSRRNGTFRNTPFLRLEPQPHPQTPPGRRQKPGHRHDAREPKPL